MGLDYSYGCRNGQLRCFRIPSGAQSSADWLLVNDTSNCEGTVKPDCTHGANYGSAIKPVTPKSALPKVTIVKKIIPSKKQLMPGAKKNFRNFMGAESSSMKSNGVYVATCGIGAFAGYKLYKGKKELGLVAGVGAGLILGTIINNLI